MNWRRVRYSLFQDRRCRSSSRAVGLGIGGIASMMAVQVMHAQGMALTPSVVAIIQGDPTGVIELAEALVVPTITGLCAGLVGWGVYRTRVSHLERRQDKYDEELKSKANRDYVDREMEHAEELWRAQLQLTAQGMDGIQKAIQEASRHTEGLREDYQADRVNRDHLLRVQVEAMVRQLREEGRL